MSHPGQSSGTWTLLTGHGHVLVEIARNPEARIRDISPVVGLTERSVQAIVADLEAAGYLTRTRTGNSSSGICAPPMAAGAAAFAAHRGPRDGPHPRARTAKPGRRRWS